VGQSAAAVARFAARRPVEFPLLLDPSREVIRAYGVYQFLWFDAFNIARPAVFVIDAGGTIRKIFVGESQTDRPAAGRVRDALLAAGAGAE
jgi:peroxiredoxin